MIGWRADTGPWTPLIEEGKLYGRGGADDGYAVFASLSALRGLHEQKIAHARCVGLIECCEESGSYDLPAYLQALAARIGKVDLVVGLDSGCGNYDQLWMTTSLRGLAAGTLTVEVLTEGVHSGDASGVVPSSFRIARQLLDRLEDAADGRILPKAFHVQIPEERLQQAQQAGQILGNTIWTKFPFAGDTRSMVTAASEAVLNRTWRPFLSVVGADGLPAIKDAGNVLRPRTALKLSLRIPPLIDGKTAVRELKRILEADPPHAAKVTFSADQSATGWNAPATAPWLQTAVNDASQAYYGNPAAMMGEGGTIPFMAMLGEQFPAAQFLITGCWARIPTRTARTSSCISSTRRSSPVVSRMCWRRTCASAAHSAKEVTRQVGRIVSGTSARSSMLTPVVISAESMPHALAPAMSVSS
jgi:acetylornithine deacetylase/succinyl-diaminopimelate desuccinylase-like protein